MTKTDRGGSEGQADSSQSDLQVEVERVGNSLRIAWTLTNSGDSDLAVFENARRDETPDAERYGAYVTGRDESTVEISRRLFPVPDDLEGAEAYGVTASVLPAGESMSRREIVLLPIQYMPAAPEGGGDPLPGGPTKAVFCVGVGPADEFPASSSAGVPEGYRFVRHSEANVALQTVLCGDIFDLPID